MRDVDIDQDKIERAELLKSPVRVAECKVITCTEPQNRGFPENRIYVLTRTTRLPLPPQNKTM